MPVVSCIISEKKRREAERAIDFYPVCGRRELIVQAESIAAYKVIAKTVRIELEEAGAP